MKLSFKQICETKKNEITENYRYFLIEKGLYARVYELYSKIEAKYTASFKNEYEFRYDKYCHSYIVGRFVDQFQSAHLDLQALKEIFKRILATLRLGAREYDIEIEKIIETKFFDQEDFFDQNSDINLTEIKEIWSDLEKMTVKFLEITLGNQNFKTPFYWDLKEWTEKWEEDHKEKLENEEDFIGAIQEDLYNFYKSEYMYFSFERIDDIEDSDKAHPIYYAKNFLKLYPTLKEDFSITQKEKALQEDEDNED